MQREDTTATDSDALDLDEYMDQDLDEILDELRGPDVPSYEVIGATTGAENSAGELTAAVNRLWRRNREEPVPLLDLYRQVARENTAGRRAPLPVESPASEEVTFAQRWALVWAAADYRLWGDMPEIAALLRRGSTFQRALRGEFDHIENVRDPNDETMRDTFFDAVLALSHAVPYGEVGQLVVNFQGHGGGGAIYGVNEGDGLGPDELRGWAEMAQEFHVHVVFILDTCNVGQAVTYAQAELGEELGEDIGSLPPEEQQALTDRMAVARQLGSHVFHLNHFLDRLYDLRRPMFQQAGRDEAQPYFGKISDRLDELANFVLHPPEGAPDLGEIITIAFPASVTALLGHAEPTRRRLFQLRREIAPLLDHLNDTINQILLEVRTRLAAARSQQGPGTDGQGPPPRQTGS